MTFDDPLMVQWIQAVAPFAAQASACQFGKDWAKTWMFVANRPEIFAVARSCPHEFGAHQQISGIRMADGSFFSRLTAEYPQELASALATLIAPFVSKGNTVLPLDSWKNLLPSKLQWPTSHQRIEDGGGLPSSALHMSRPFSDPLVGLRSRWFKRLSDTKHCFKIVAALSSGCKEPPPQDELVPYIEDLLEVLECPPGDHILHTPPGQPFRLHLWYHLTSFLGDPDAHFLLDLVQGVPLGVNQTLTPSPAWPTHAGTVTDPEPLLQCSDSWKSAQDHPEIVDQLIAEELQAGFIELVPGCLSELQATYNRTAVHQQRYIQHHHPQPHDVASHFRCPCLCTIADGSATDDTTYIGCCQGTPQDPHRPQRWGYVMLSRQW